MENKRLPISIRVSNLEKKAEQQEILLQAILKSALEGKLNKSNIEKSVECDNNGRTKRQEG